MRRAIVVLSACMLAALPAQAQPAAGKPGLWEVRTTKQVVNGQDMLGQMQAMQAQMAAAMKNMPPEQRKMMQAKMGQSGIDMQAGAARLCLTADHLAQQHPASAQIPEGVSCEPHQISRSGNTQHFATRCRQRDGSTIDVRGTSTTVSEIEHRNEVTVKTTGGPRPGTMETAGTLKWLGADCGAVKPLPMTAVAAPAKK